MPTRVIEVQKGTWLYTHNIIGWCEDESEKCLIVYTNNGDLKFEYPHTEMMLDVSKTLRQAADDVWANEDLGLPDEWVRKNKA